MNRAILVLSIAIFAAHTPQGFASNEAINYKIVLSFAKNKIKKKDAYESWVGYRNRQSIDCAATQSLFCKSVYIERDLYTNYNPDSQQIEFGDPFDLGPLSVVDGYFPIEPNSQYCASINITSRKSVSSVFSNGFGATTVGESTTIKWDGVVFYPREKGFDLDTGCIDRSVLKSNDPSILTPRQILPILPTDARKENGEFAVRLYAIPQLPYFTVLEHDSGRTFLNPDRMQETGSALIVKPLKWQIFGKRTKKVYFEGDFPITNQYF